MEDSKIINAHTEIRSQAEIYRRTQQFMEDQEDYGGGGRPVRILLAEF